METIPRFSPAAVICLTLLIVVAVNAGLILAVRRGGEVDLLRRASKAARNPWAEQEGALGELRERVSQLESEETDAPEPDG